MCTKMLKCALRSLIIRAMNKKSNRNSSNAIIAVVGQL